MSPIDIAVVLLLIVWLTRAATERRLTVPRTQVSATLGVLVVLAGIALVRGLMESGGSADTAAALWEIRPWVYLGATYLFTSQVIRSRRAVQAVLWTFVIGSGFKALQGVYIYFETVSYTHLDVYKRQGRTRDPGPARRPGRRHRDGDDHLSAPRRAPGGAHRHREAPALGSRGHHRPPTPPATERQQKLSRVSRLRCAPAPAADRCSVCLLYTSRCV